MIWALQDVSFEVQPGEVVGIIGRNGAGKSTLLKILSRITEPTDGWAEIRGRVGSLLEVGTGFHPELTGRENIFLNGAILGMKRSEIRKKFDEIVSFSEIEKFIDTPVKRYSSGMYMRLAFAVAAHMEPEILLVDEVLAVGDAGFQKKCLGKMGEVAKQGRTVLFVSHSMPAVQQLCSKGVLLADGHVVQMGETKGIITKYLSLTDNRRKESLGILAKNAEGTVEVNSIDLRDETGQLLQEGQCGKDLIISVDFKTTQPYDRAAMSISINDQFGIRISVLHSRVTGFDFPLSSCSHRVSCRLRRFPLLPGRYILDLKILAGHEVILWKPQVQEMYVVGGDYHHTGKLADAEWGGFFCIDQDWEHTNEYRA
jgi:lipopolysaccharide transport system ATP-binding protein